MDKFGLSYRVLIKVIVYIVEIIEKTIKKALAEANAEAIKSMEQALKDLKVAEEKATSAEALTAETRKNNDTLQSELSKAKEQLSGYDDLKKSEFEAKKALIVKEREMNEKIRELDRENAKLKALIKQLQMSK